MKAPEKEDLNNERNELLNRIEEALELPLIILGFIWLILLVIELLWELNPILQIVTTVIWVIFIIDFIIKFILAPVKLAFLKSNVITAVSLLIPALRIFRITRAFRIIRTLRAARGARLFRIIASLNRGMRSLSATMQRRAFGYVLLLTLVVLFIGAAGMFNFEKEVNGFETYSAAVWWTAMLFTSLGSEYWPQTAEGKVLCFFLGLYGFMVFGYFTATLASYFLGRDAEDDKAEIAGTKQIELLQQEIIALRQTLQEVLQKYEKH